MIEAGFIFSVFMAGLVTFLAPCTLPLIPGYLGFNSGVSLHDVRRNTSKGMRQKIFINGLLYVIGFSVVFVVLGSLFGWIGGALFAESRLLATRIGGLLVIIFGLIMLQQSLVLYQDRLPALKGIRPLLPSWLLGEYHMPGARALRPGTPGAALLFGGIFAMGWTPCIGPVLGAVLTLAATKAGAGEGAILLSLFSLGLGIPFLFLAATVGYASHYLSHISGYLPAISLLGGIFIIFLGVLITTNNMGLWNSYFFSFFTFLHYDRLLDWL
ncbi:MAG: cytochrome c biogenesis CcdA family protein [Acidobacteriota bacterium]